LISKIIIILFSQVFRVKAIKEKIIFPENSKFYTVGEKSRQALEKMGFSVEIVAKNALELSDKIQELNPIKIMHFCSSKALSTLKNQLSEAGFDFAEKIVYETIPLSRVEYPDGCYCIFQSFRCRKLYEKQFCKK
jgi:uroporphyrinogen-III synthase